MINTASTDVNALGVNGPSWPTQIRRSTVHSSHVSFLTHRLRLSPISKRWRHFTWSIRGRCSKSDGSNKITATAGHMRNIFCCRDGVLAMFLSARTSTHVNLALSQPLAQGWKRTSSQPRCRWSDQIRKYYNDSPSADLWKNARCGHQWRSDATAHADYALITTPLQVLTPIILKRINVTLMHYYIRFRNKSENLHEIYN